VNAYDEANALQRGIRRFASSGPGSWLFARILDHLDRPVYRATRRRHTLTSLLAGLPTVVLTTTGARTGRRCSVPLVGLPTPEGIAVIGSNYGQRHHPAWYHNLRADPDAELDGRRVRAVEVDGERRERIWAQALKAYPGYSTYERRAAHRRIGVFVLEPVTTGTAAGASAGAGSARP
jgi:deazaflavin-dependent oxidoreductase (nitroreductase family)